MYCPIVLIEFNVNLNVFVSYKACKLKTNSSHETLDTLIGVVGVNDMAFQANKQCNDYVTRKREEPYLSSSCKNFI